MNKVQECARALGEAIIASDEYKNMQIAESAAMNDPAATEAMSRFMELRSMLNTAMSMPEPDAAQIAKYGQEIDELQQTLNNMPSIDAMTSSRQAFSAMMNQVNKILEFMITGEVEQGGCSGNCGGCSGCH